MLCDLADRGIKRLLIEGGSNIHTMFLEADLVDELRLAVAPFFVGEAGAPHFVNSAKFPFNATRHATLVNCSPLGDIAILIYKFKK